MVKRTLVYASGNAVQLDNSCNVGKLRVGGGGSGELNWAGHDVPPYMPWGDIDSTTDSTTVKPVEPLEVSMSRVKKIEQGCLYSTLYSSYNLQN